MHRALPQSKKKMPDRTPGNHVHSAGVHEKEIRETGRKSKKNCIFLTIVGRKVGQVVDSLSPKQISLLGIRMG